MKYGNIKEGTLKRKTLQSYRGVKKIKGFHEWKYMPKWPKQGN